MELETIIGLEIHAQLNTNSKLFSPSDNDAWGAKPNTRINEIDMGFPGVLPVLNQVALQKAVAGAAALGCKIQPFSKFDRKNYFYPDLPFGYQISQYDEPFSLDGKVLIDLGETEKEIGITRVHLEIDAGKLTHTDDATLCDYNRAGSPLIEIVTEPDMRNPEEAQALAKEIQKILRYVDASDADMEKGMMRFDASISMRPKGDSKLYPRAEIKNLNSFTALYKALQYEQKRQAALWEKGTPSEKEQTLGWLDKEEKTIIRRDKESADDYRYFPEPDLPPVTFTETEITEIEKAVPELPFAKKKRYQSEFNLSEADSLKIAETQKSADFFEKTVSLSKDPKKSANFFLSVVLTDENWKKSFITPEKLADTIDLISKGKISATSAKDIILIGMETEKSSEKIMEEAGLEQVSDDNALEEWVEEVLAENPAVVQNVKNAPDEDKKSRFIGPLIGQVMKKSGGSANPKMVREIVLQKIG